MIYLLVLARLVAVTAVFMFVALIMGKRHLGELSVFDFIIAIVLGSLVGAELANPGVPEGPTIVLVLGLGLIQYLLSYGILKWRKLGKLITFDPTIVMQNGLILKDNLAKMRFTVDELLSLLRLKEVFDLSEVEYAVLEPNGQLSVLRKSQHQPVTPKNLALPTDYEGLSIPLVLEGRVHQPGLRAAKLSEAWLRGELLRKGFKGPEEIFLAMLDTRGELYLSPQRPPLPVERIEH